MSQTMLFGEILEAAEQLSLDEQTTLLSVLRQRVAERGRQRILEEIRQAQEEFAAGLCRPTTVDDLMNEILS
jgi:hypothetical protein